jgi:NADPH:quinone reductase-like Zn-dependent oxidoreductase
MRAWVMHEVGGPESYQLEEVETPQAGAAQVRVRLRSAALNHLDLWVSRGLPKPELPHVAGADGAGVVDEVGRGVDRVSVGERVIINPSVACGHCPACLAGRSPFCESYGILGEHLWGTFAEQVVLPAANVVPKAEHLSWEEAGAFGLSTGTAYRMLRRARLRPGDVFLVVGIGGGVSSAGLLLGLAMGARVYVTSTRPEKIKRALELGAAGGFSSNDQFAEQLKGEVPDGADVVLENVGPATWEQSVRSLARGGRLVVCGGTSGAKVQVHLPSFFFKQLELIGSTMFDYAEFADVVGLVADGRVPVLVDKVFGFEDLPSALAHLDSGAQFGKVVIRHS